MAESKYSHRSTFASLPGVTRGESVSLGGDPKGQNFLYCNGLNVYIRDIEDCSKCVIYSQHAVAPLVARYSPSRFYIASGDSSGKVRVWDTVNQEQQLKIEHQPISGKIKDIAWGDDSKKLVVGGEGRETYAKAITFDSGNTCGELGGHSKLVNRVAFKPNRPFRAVTVSEDYTARFYQNLPLKIKSTFHDHTNFVNTVKYHPNGDVFITGGADGMAFVYDGKEGEKIGTLGEKAHNGQIYDMDFSDNGDEVLTVSGDKTAKIWNVASRELVMEFKFGNDLMDMMLGCLWQGKHLLVVTLSGYIHYLDRNNSNTPLKTIKGHYRPIMSMAVTADGMNIYTGASDGQICGWDVNTGTSDLIQGKGHSNQVTAMTIVDGKLITIGMDDEVRYTALADIGCNMYGSEAVKLPSQPRALAATGTSTVIACENHIVVLSSGIITSAEDVKFEPTSVDIDPKGGCVVIGTAKDSNIYLYGFNGHSVINPKKYDTEDTVSSVKFSPNGEYLVVALAERKKCKLLKCVGEPEEIYTLTKQTSKIVNLAWSPNSKYYASGSLDGSIVIWRCDKKYDANVVCYIKNAHAKKGLRGLSWLSNDSIVSAGDDSNVKIWDLKLE